MQSIDEIRLAKELIRFPSITPNDEGAIYFLSKSTQQKIKDLEIELVGWKEVMALNLLHA